MCLVCQHVQQSQLLPSDPGDQGYHLCQLLHVCHPPLECQEILGDRGYHGNLEVRGDPTRQRGGGDGGGSKGGVVMGEKIRVSKAYDI